MSIIERLAKIGLRRIDQPTIDDPIPLDAREKAQALYTRVAEGLKERRENAFEVSDDQGRWEVRTLRHVTILGEYDCFALTKYDHAMTHRRWRHRNFGSRVVESVILYPRFVSSELDFSSAGFRHRALNSTKTLEVAGTGVDSLFPVNAETKVTSTQSSEAPTITNG